MKIKDKIAIVTGGAGGIGLRITQELLAAKVKILAIFDVDNSRCREAFDQLKEKHGERVEFYPGDVTKSQDFGRNLHNFIATYKTVDIFVNNPGVGQETKPELMIDANLRAVMLGSYHVIDKIGKNEGGNGGVIVNIASVLGLTKVLFPTYDNKKPGVVSFTRTMKRTFSITNVRVVAICPDFPVNPNVFYIIKKNEEDFLVDMEMRVCKSSYNVAAAVISIIERGKPGDVWISEADKPPRPAPEEVLSCPSTSSIKERGKWGDELLADKPPSPVKKVSSYASTIGIAEQEKPGDKRISEANQAPSPAEPVVPLPDIMELIKEKKYDGLWKFERDTPPSNLADFSCGCISCDAEVERRRAAWFANRAAEEGSSCASKPPLEKSNVN